MTKSRRFILGVIGVVALLALGIYNKNSGDVAFAIAAISLGVSAANSFEGSKKKETKE